MYRVVFVVHVHLFFVSWCSGMQTCVPSAASPVTQQPPFVLYFMPAVSAHSGLSANPQTTLTQGALQTTEQQTHIPVTLTNTNTYLNSISGLMSQLSHAIPSLYASLSAFLYAHKWSCIGVTIGVTYATLFILFFLDRNFMYNQALWARWHQPQTVAELCEIPHETLCKELILAIHTRYVNQANPADMMTPLSVFLYEIAAEERHLQRCCTRARFAQKLYLDKVLPCASNAVQEAELLIERLAFIKHIFLSWMSAYNWQGLTKESEHR
jgi:hypothetical protein